MLNLYFTDWVSLAIKFLHVIAGIAWIGASFYFNWLENNLNRDAKKNKDDITGHLWAVHGGGFYFLQKFNKYPDQLPKELHWFKWEAYFTWISGFMLLGIIYYLNAQSYLLLNDSTFSPNLAIALSIAGLAVAWVIYDLICKTKIVKNPYLVLFLLSALFLIAAYLYGLVFNPRAVFMQIGAMMGTIMVANVFFVIIPVQKKLVKACADKAEISSELGFSGYIRSRHNNYFTLPVVFIMISNHYPFVYSSAINWLTLFAFFVIAVAIRHYFNLRGENKTAATNKYWIVFVILAIVAMFIILSPVKIFTGLTNEATNSPGIKAESDITITADSKITTTADSKITTTADSKITTTADSKITTTADSDTTATTDTDTTAIATAKSDATATAVSFTKVKSIIQARCISCHSQNPSDDVFKIAPNGFKLDTDKQILFNKNLIYMRTVATNSMPFANKTKITQAERDYLRQWFTANE